MKKAIKEALKKVYFSYLKKKRIKENRKIDLKERKKLSRHEIVKQRDKRAKNIYEKVILTKEQEAQIDALFEKHYGEKIPYTWHRRYTAYTGKFDANYFPELLHIPEFEYFMCPIREYSKAFSDKNILPLFAEKAGVKMPKTIVSCTAGEYRDTDYNVISKEQAVNYLKNQKFFIKPSVNGGSGAGCRLCKGNEDINKLLDEMGKDFVAQEVLKCNETITKIYSGSVNTFRVNTFRWKGEIKHLPVIMRIGQGGNYLDNAHAGGMFIAVDNDGTLHDTAFTEFLDSFKAHPDSGLVFDGYKIEGLEKVISAAKAVHEQIPQIGSVHWDFTIDETGAPVLIEANISFGSIWIMLMSHGCGAFGDLTPEILEWVKKMKETPVEERYLHSFGE